MREKIWRNATILFFIVERHTFPDTGNFFARDFCTLLCRLRCGRKPCSAANPDLSYRRNFHFSNYDRTRIPSYSYSIDVGNTRVKIDVRRYLNAIFGRMSLLESGQKTWRSTNEFPSMTLRPNYFLATDRILTHPTRLLGLRFTTEIFLWDRPGKSNRFGWISNGFQFIAEDRKSYLEPSGGCSV